MHMSTARECLNGPLAHKPHAGEDGAAGHPRARRPHLVGLVGSGVGPSLTPALHMAEAAAHGLPYLYRTLDLGDLGLSPTDIGGLLRQTRALGYDGLNVTHPCKQVVLDHLDRLHEAAARIGAVNTVLFEAGEAVGYNTDSSGFAAAMRHGLPGADLREVVQLGAGGAGAAVAHALLGLGVGRLRLVDPDLDRGAAVAEDLGARFPRARVSSAGLDRLPALLPGATGLAHCTPTGMAGHPGLPLDPALLHSRMWVTDIVYRPLETPLLAAARAAGCTTLHGGHMAVYQAVEALRLIAGIEPDPDRMLAHFTQLAGASRG